jgi:toxin ParE1/3/4
VGIYRLTPAAQRDLSSIWDYTEDRWGILQAENYVTEIRRAIEWIADDPTRGRSCDEIRPGYRRYSTGSHLVFYLATAAGVDVMRILRQWMDPTRHL